MGNKILAIIERKSENPYEIHHPNSFGGWNEEYEGYEILTEKGQIYILINNSQSCCENWGYFAGNDDLESFIGAELLSVNRVDNCLNVSRLPGYGLDEGIAIFINLETDRGTLQFTVYNSHNGYYSHGVIIKSQELNIKEYL
jgi:hypothetical protein